MNRSALRHKFGNLPDGGRVFRVVLQHESLIEVAVISYGAAIQSLNVPDRNGTLANIVFGHDGLDGYVGQRNYFGASVGRYANRIARGQFEIDGKNFQLDANDGPNALHGGLRIHRRRSTD